MSEWYYGQGGQQEGPIDEATMRSRIASGQVGPADLVWREGMAEWLPLAQVTELAPAPASAETSPYATPGTNPVAAPQQYYAPAAPTSGLAIASMVCGILSIIFCYVNALVGIPAVICGHMAMKRIKASQGQIAGQGMALAGLICGYIGIVLQLITIGFFVFIFAAAASNESSSSKSYVYPESAEESWDAAYESTKDENTD
ncbi:GYF domain-containing protein [Akkermansiaceae bacterium]|nr:GYF domain-containing protein [Akkermansiaceae bacterium]MDB4525882.1 GYF domain-containing protein [Akkermansiaceae bacterium]MDB4547596.1 GYF domain-containing protein [Akkermansiaceae bacterium]